MKSVVEKRLWSAALEKAELSVIVASRNRAESLAEVLGDLALQATGGRFRFEVIVVDNNSKDGTRPMVEQRSAAYPVPLRYALEKREGKSYALNTGIDLAQGDWLVFVDDDVRIEKDHLEKIYQTFTEENADGVGGPTVPLWMDDRSEWLSDTFVRQLGIVNYGTEKFIMRDMRKALIGANCAYRKSLFEKYGGYTPEVNYSDTDWFVDVVNAGHKVVYLPDLTARHKISGPQMTKRYMVRRLFNQGRDYSSGIQRVGGYRGLFRIPFWSVKLYVALHFQALGEWLRGNKEKAYWDWMRRHIYGGMIVFSFRDWLRRTPIARQRPVLACTKNRAAGLKQTPLKVVIVAPEVFPVPPVKGGAVETLIEEVSRQLLDHEVHILSVTGPELGNFERKGARTYHRFVAGLLDRLLLSSWKLPFKKSVSQLYYRPYRQWASGLVKKIKPDVIWVHSRIQFVEGLRKAAPEARLILSLHNESNLNAGKVWNSKNIGACDKITACSEFLAAETVRRYPETASKISALHNGVDEDDFQPVWQQPSAGAALRSQLGLGDGPVVLFAGRLVEEKGAHILIESFKQVLSKVPDAQLLIAGAYTFSDNRTTPYIEALKEKAKGLESRIRFLGHVPRAEIRKYFLGSDLFAFPSLWKEPFGMAVLEAMACGLPVMAFDQGGPREIIENSKSGVLVPCGDDAADHFAATLTDLLKDAGRREVLGRGARKRVENYFTWKQMAGRLLALCGEQKRILIAESGSGWGGTAKYLGGLAGLLDPEKFSVKIAAYEEGPFIRQIRTEKRAISLVPGWKLEEKAGGRILFLAGALWQILRKSPVIYRTLKREKIELVHLNNEILTHLPLLIAAHFAGVRVLCHLHGWRPLTRLERVFLPWVDRFVVISESGAKYFAAQIPESKISAVPNGLAVNGAVKNLEAKRLALRVQLGLDSKVFLAGLVGRLVEWKGHETYLQALSFAVQKNSGIHGLILGHDNAPGEPYRKHLEKRVRDLGLEKNVHFLPWQEDVWAVYAACDLVVHASTEPEPFGLVVLEAMLASKPVVATKAGGVMDLVADGVTGLLVEPGKAEALADAITRIAVNPGWARELARKAEERGRTEFSLERNVAGISKIYERLLEK